MCLCVRLSVCLSIAYVIGQTKTQILSLVHLIFVTKSEMTFDV